MDPTDDRSLPLASVWLYDEGQGDPVVIDHGFAHLDILAETWQFGTYSRASNGVSQLEFLKGLGLVNRPVVNQQDTRLAQYVTSGGDWEEVRPATGAPRVYRLVQFDTTAGVQYSATSTFNLPQNPHVAFALVLPDVPSDWDTVTHPPYVQIELGGGKWAIYFGQNGQYLLAKVNGVWQAVAEIPKPQTGGYQEVSEFAVMLRCYRDRIGISTDGGHEYTWFGWPDGTPATIMGGKLTVRGQGGSVSFGLWQIQYASGNFASAPRNTFHSRSFASAIITGRYDAPSGTSVSFSDRSTPANAVAQWQTTLVPNATAGTPFRFYTGPALYSVTFRYPVRATLPFGSYTTPWDGAITSVDINKPLELDGATCTIIVRQDAGQPLVGSYRYRKVRVWLGEVHANGARTLRNVFTGMIRRVEPTWDDFGSVTLALTLENVTQALKDAEWTDLDCVALGGMTPNAAADYILATEGFDASYRSWHPTGAAVPMPPGLAEDPFEMLKRGEKKWETLTRIFGYLGLEVAALDDGTLASGPKQFAQPVTSYAYHANPSTDLRSLVRSISNPVDYGESATAVLVTGTGVNGERLLAWAVDEAAELSVVSGRFSPRRKVIQDELEGTTTPALLATRAQSLALENFTVKYEPEVRLPVRLETARRDCVAVYGCGVVGLEEGAQCVVLSLRHSYRADPSFASLETTAGLRRL